MDDIVVRIEKILKNNGYKFTIQKLAILEVLIESKTHLNSKEIHDRLKDKRIGLSTIHRTLNLFKTFDIVKEININGIGYFELKIFSKDPFHIHFKCSKCNSIIDIKSKDINLQCLELKNKAEMEKDLDIYDIDIIFTGLCSKCKEELRWQDQQKLEQ